MWYVDIFYVFRKEHYYFSRYTLTFFFFWLLLFLVFLKAKN